MDRIADVFALIVVTGMVGVIVGSPNTRQQIDSLWNGFTNSILAATGQGRQVRR